MGTYDCNSEESFRTIRSWADDIQRYAGMPAGPPPPVTGLSFFSGPGPPEQAAREGPVVYLCANKNDLPAKVDFNRAKQLAKELQFDACYSMSAKEGEGVAEAFEAIANSVVKQSGIQLMDRARRIRSGSVSLQDAPAFACPC